jgi:hypothetical protein
MEAKNKKATRRKNKPAKRAGANTGPGEIQVWRKDLLEAVRSGLCYTLKDVVAASGVSEMVVLRIMKGNPEVQYRKLEAVVSALHLRMGEVFDQEANVAGVLKRVYDRVQLNWEIKDLNGAVVAIKADGTVIKVSDRQKAASRS